MAYTVKEIFHTLQGEGVNAGRAAVFLRFAGCNLWSGREEDRAAAACSFCDTDFVGGERFTDALGLARAVAAAWGPVDGPKMVVCTGGEPALQLDAALVDALHGAGFEVAIETNGTRPLPAGLDWVCVSPKGANPLAVTAGDELKLVFPQPDAPPAAFEQLGFRHFVLQPMDGPERTANTAACVAYCRAHPRWRLGLQTHKILGIP
ncbi:MAG: 7-carboxy-7-deazaguanine synthase [Actinomycetota bacterium]